MIHQMFVPQERCVACLALDFARMRFCDEVQEPRAADAEVLAMILFECWSVLFLTILETWIFHDLPIKVKVKKRGLSAFAAFRGHPLQVSLTAFFAADHITLGVEAGSWPVVCPLESGTAQVKEVDTDLAPAILWSWCLKC